MRPSALFIVHAPTVVQKWVAFNTATLQQDVSFVTMDFIHLVTAPAMRSWICKKFKVAVYGKEALWLKTQWDWLFVTMVAYLNFAAYKTQFNVSPLGKFR